MTIQRSSTLEAEALATSASEADGLDVTKEYISEDIYWEKYYDFPDISYEWNNGLLEEIPPTNYV